MGRNWGSIDDIIEYNRDVHEGYKQDQRDHKKAMAKKKKRLVKGSKWNPIKAISKKKDLINFVKNKEWGGRGDAKRIRSYLRLHGIETGQFKGGPSRVKQVLPTVGRTLGAASGWGTLIAGVSLLAQTKKAKQFRQDPIHRRATIKKLFKVRN